MNKEFVPYELALKLKQLGFDEPCFAYFEYDKNLVYTGIVSQNKNSFWVTNELIITAPTFSQAFRWFREKHELFCWIEKFHVDETYIFQIPPANFTKIQGHYITYEEAELSCLTKLIEIVEEA